MLYDSIGLLGDSQITNITVDSGSSFPSNPSTGEVFFKSDEKQLYMYEGASWVQITGEVAASTPKITAVEVTDSSYVVLDDTAVDTAGGYIKISGSGFAESASVLINQTALTNVTYVSATELRAQVPATAAGTYTLYVVNTDGSVAIRLNGITFSPFPSWSTGSSLSSVNDSISIQLSASSALTYALAPGSTLPTGLTLSSSGLLSGSLPEITETTTYNFSVIATDAENQEATRAFSITITAGDPFFANTALLLNTNDTAFTADASANNFEMAVNGDVKANSFSPFTPGYYSAFFDGTGDFLTVPSSTQFGFETGDFTVEFWVYRMSSARQDWVYISNVSPASRLLVYYTSSTVQVYCYPPNSSIITGSNISDSAWTHIAVTRQTGAIKLFINGQQSGSTYSTSLNLGSACGITIGKDSFGTTHMTGEISNLRIVKGTALYTSNFTPSTTPLTAVSGTSLLTCQSARFIDNSPNSFAITRNGDARIESSNPFTPPSEYSLYGSAYYDGTGDSLTTPSSAALAFGSSDFTMEAWIFPVASTANMRVWQFTGGSTAYNLSINTNGAGAISYDAGGTIYTSASNPIQLNTWQHIALVRSAGTGQVYVNGVSVISGADSSNVTSARVLNIGGSSSPLFIGYISNMRVVSGTALYTSNFTPSTTPLTAVANTQLLTLQNNKPANNIQFTDESTNNFVVSRLGNATQSSFTPYGEDWSAFFDGTGDYLSVAANAAFAMGTGDFTVEGWVNYSNRTNSGIFQISATLFAGTTGIALGLSSDLKWLLYHGSSSQTAATTGPNAATWHHFAVVRNSGVTKVYIDGTATSISVADTTNYTVNTLGIGGIYSTSYLINGSISNFRVVKGTAIYTGNFTPPKAKLTAVSGTSLLTCQSNRFVDRSSNSFAITRNGDSKIVRYSPFHPLLDSSNAKAAYSASTNGGSMFFDGTGDYLAIPTNAAFAFGTGDFTIEFWMYTTGSIALGAAVYEGRGNASSTAAIYVANNGQVYVGSSSVLGAVATITANTWVHFALSRQGTTLRRFINGVLTNSVTNSTSLVAPATELRIGTNDAAGGTFAGHISNLRVVKGIAVYITDFTPSIQPTTAISGTQLLLNGTNPAVFDATARNAIETIANTKASTKVTKWPSKASLYFDGTGDGLKIMTLDAITLDSADFTLEFWAYFNVTNAAMAVINKGWQQSGATFASYLIHMTNTGSLRFNASSNTASWDISSERVIGAMTAQTWTHIAVTRQGSTFRAFVNGVINSAFTFTSSSRLAANNTQLLYIGSNNVGTGVMNGYLQDVRITKGTARYTDTFSVPSAAFQNL